MATKVGSDSGSTSPESLGKIILAVILGIFFLVYLMAEYKNMKKAPAAKVAGYQQTAQTIVLPINTTVWKKIDVTYGKSIKTLAIRPQNGRVYDWYLVVNGDFKNPKRMPSGDYLGNNLQTLHCLLAADTGVESGEIEYEEK